MKNKIIIGCLCISLFFSCEKSFEDHNFNPNAVTTEEIIPADLLIKGTMLANISINLSHLQRISGMWSGQYRGEIANYLNLYNYSITASESNSAWQYLYNGILKQNREIAKYYDVNGLDAEGRLIIAISKMIEANAVGTATAIWGDIPYSDIDPNDVYHDPKFDKQTDVYAALQNLLDDAITMFQDTSTLSAGLDEDIHFGGDKAKWIEVAYTLKARYYLQTKQYSLAYQNALLGISAPDNSMKFFPTTTFGTENLLYRFGAGGNQGFMSVNNTFCRNLIAIASTNPNTRRNSKTNEVARRNYLNIDSASGFNSSIRINGERTPMNLVTYQENLLILAETGARTISSSQGLIHLNEVRAFHLTSESFNRAGTRVYNPYVLADFAPGGIDNQDNIPQDRALLREIIEERYVTGFGTFMPWNDLRRLRATDSDLMVPVPFNNNNISIYPQRFIPAQSEYNSNPNAPQGLTIFDPTEINQ
ncbi:SusD/RagB family nutrient-binding outer membrane lipoprotein [Polaribacter porphyrae]|nr:SusD/RagB family nutrient-binding outer membrane lipoprotein [Polaribacter porphyrae]